MKKDGCSDDISKLTEKVAVFPLVHRIRFTDRRRSRRENAGKMEDRIRRSP